MWVADIQQQTRPDKLAPRICMFWPNSSSRWMRLAKTPEQDFCREKSEVAEFTTAVWVFIVDLLASLV